MSGDRETGSSEEQALLVRIRELEAENAALKQVLPAAASEQRFRSLVELAPQMVWFGAPDGAIDFCNNYWWDYSGAGPGADLNQTWYELAHPDDRQALADSWRAARDSGAYQEVEVRLRRAGDGAYRWFLIRGAPLRGEDGALRLWLGLGLEIHERRMAELALSDAEEVKRIALEAGEIGVFDFNPVTRDHHWDPRLRDILGVGEAPASVELLISLLDEAHREPVRASLQRALDPDGGGEYQTEYLIHRKNDGAPRWLAVKGRAIFDNGEAVRLLGTAIDITERKDAERRQTLLINELNHRVKNTLATVQAVAARSYRSAASPDAAQKSLDSRLMALAKTHDLLTEQMWEGAELRRIVEAAAAPYDSSGSAIRTGGPRVQVSPKNALALSMALHELATNAAKYGALSTSGGAVDVRWSLKDNGGGPHLRLEWRESGGPKVEAPEKTGFGTRLIQQGLPAELGGEVEIDYDPQGLVCNIETPLPPQAR